MEVGTLSCMSFKKVIFAGLLAFSAPFLSGQAKEHAFEVAPGITLPSTGTIYGVDSLEQKPSLLQIHPTEISSNGHAGGNFARSMVYAGPHSSIELTGVSSAATFHTSKAAFYVRLTGSEDPELLRNRVKLIRLKPSKDRRVVSNYSMNIFGGQRKRQYDEVAVSKSESADQEWLTLVPQEPLPPGEYGIVFMPKDPNLFSDVVYDFSIAEDSGKEI